MLSHFGDVSSFAPTRWLTGTLRLWHNLYGDITQRVLDGTWEPGTYGGGLKENYVKLAPFGPAVTPSTIARIRTLSQGIASGDLHVYEGPLRDQDGLTRVPAGESATWSDLVAQDWMVEGVVVNRE